MMNPLRVNNALFRVEHKRTRKDDPQTIAKAYRLLEEENYSLHKKETALLDEIRTLELLAREK